MSENPTMSEDDTRTTAEEPASTTADGGTDVSDVSDAPDVSDVSTPAGGKDDSGGALDGDFVRYVNYLLLAGLVVLALVAGAQLYGAVGRTIDRWVVREYRSLFHAAFNLAVLLAAVAGISVQLRRVRG